MTGGAHEYVSDDGVIRVVITPTQPHHYAREIRINDEVAYLLPDHEITWPGRGDEPIQAAGSALLSLLSQLQTDVTDRETNLGNIGELQRRFGSYKRAIYTMYRSLRERGEVTDA